jgi:hypothetical protein
MAQCARSLGRCLVRSPLYKSLSARTHAASSSTSRDESFHAWCMMKKQRQQTFAHEINASGKAWSDMQAKAILCLGSKYGSYSRSHLSPNLAPPQQHPRRYTRNKR